MTATSEPVDIQVGDDQIAGTFLTPQSKIPGVLFVHGWGGSQESDLARARGIAGLGCICLTFDLRGHARTVAQKEQVTREHNLKDLCAAYDLLAEHPSIDPGAIAVVGSSYGGYLASILTGLRTVRWLALQVPALYRDEGWSLPKGKLNREQLQAYRRERVTADGNRALSACSQFSGDVLIVESEHDHLIPHETIMSYRNAFVSSHSLTHRIIDGADHALTGKNDQDAYTSILVSWVTEMVVGARVGDSPQR
ncbi:alpha/beta hydrolase family protein [Hydrocarboniclastica marina]|uniref:Alpha/beta fold hydrolase n=1 Tax=Hydrocarboniclastica marina TaxID=2259620 RepID=A0A4P7XHN8_9ALTE|nr:alpha/beta fold hydrolase [Hydrocarboniclastica marina]MAL99227.1 alpha/beta hydrolase [Alteromonadaceae bacterium]QCF25974.1 alpha/beta fold hydrolase [Hydrocarboniclastica marina]